MDKATKLESIRDGIETVRARFEAKGAGFSSIMCWRAEPS